MSESTQHHEPFNKGVQQGGTVGRTVRPHVGCVKRHRTGGGKVSHMSLTMPNRQRAGYFEMSITTDNRAHSRPRKRLPFRVRRASEARRWSAPLLATSLLALATGCGDNPTTEFRRADNNIQWNGNSQWVGGDEKTFHFVDVDIERQYGNVAIVTIDPANNKYGFWWEDMPETQEEGRFYASVSVRGSTFTSLTPRSYMLSVIFDPLNFVLPHTWAAFVTFSVKWCAIGAILVAAILYTLSLLEERWPQGIGSIVADWINSKTARNGDPAAEHDGVCRNPFFHFEHVSLRQLIGVVAGSLCFVLGCGAMLWIGTDLTTSDYIVAWSAILFFGFGLVVGCIGLVGRLHHRHEFEKQPQES